VEFDTCRALARLNLDGYFATVVAHAKLDLPDLRVPARRGEPAAFLPTASDLDRSVPGPGHADEKFIALF
jgi:hypothetical protein